MPLSGSLNFTINRDQLLFAGFGLIGMYTEAETPSAFMMQQANTSLNSMLKAFVTDGFHLWVRKQGVLFLEPGKQSYVLGPDGPYGARGTSYVQTTLTTAAAAAATSLAVASSSGIAVNDHVGIVRSDGTIQWTTVATVPDSTHITIPGPGIVGSATSGSIVYAYTSAIYRPMRLLYAVLRDPTGTDIPVEMIPLNTYMGYPLKSSRGASLQAAYDPTLDDGTLYVWPTIDQQGSKMVLLYSKPFDDMDNATDTLEFPQEWLEAITYGLGARLADIFHLPLNVRGYLWNQARAMKEDLNDFDRETTAIFIQPRFQ